MPQVHAHVMNVTFKMALLYVAKVKYEFLTSKLMFKEGDKKGNKLSHFRQLVKKAQGGLIYIGKV